MPTTSELHSQLAIQRYTSKVYQDDGENSVSDTSESGVWLRKSCLSQQFMRVEAADRTGVTGEAWADFVGYDGAESLLSLHRFNRNEAMFIPSDLRNLRNLRNLRTRFRVWFIRAHTWFYPNQESV